MDFKKLFGFVSGVFMIGTTAAMADTPSPLGCDAIMPNAGEEALVLFCLPDGSGNSFTQAQILGDGTVVDATIQFTIETEFGEPLYGLPAEDMWLESGDTGLMVCVGGTIADHSTDEFGITTWSNPLKVGGFGSGGCYIFISGGYMFCYDSPSPFDLTFNSADITGDGIVNLADIGVFSGIYFDPSSYDLAVDFFADGALNLADVGRLARGVGASCP